MKLWGNFVWTECSDAIQHLWEKFGGIKIPSAYLPLFMDEYTLESIDTLEDDPYTYYRTVARGTSDERRFKKVIFGFPNREVLEKYINDRNITLKELCMEYGVDPNEVLNEEFQYRNAPKRLWPQLRLLKHYHRKFLDGMMEVTLEEQKVLNNALLDVYNEFDDKWENNSKIDGLWKLIVDIAFSLNRSIVLRIYEFGEMLELEREVFSTYHLMPTTL